MTAPTATTTTAVVEYAVQALEEVPKSLHSALNLVMSNSDESRKFAPVSFIVQSGMAFITASKRIHTLRVPTQFLDCSRVHVGACRRDKGVTGREVRLVLWRGYHRGYILGCAFDGLDGGCRECKGRKQD